MMNWAIAQGIDGVECFSNSQSYVTSRLPSSLKFLTTLEKFIVRKVLSRFHGRFQTALKQSEI